MTVIVQLIGASILGVLLLVSYVLGLYVFDIAADAIIEFFFNKNNKKTFFQWAKFSRDNCSFWQHVGNGWVITTVFLIFLFIACMIGAYAIDIFNCL